MKNTNTLYILVVALGLSIGAYFYFKKKNEDALNTTNEILGTDGLPFTVGTTPTVTTPAAVATPMPKGSLPFKIGSRGKLVQLMQVVLNVTPDGIWGPKTQAAFDSKLSENLKALVRAGKVADLDKIFAPKAGEKHFPFLIGKNNSTAYVKCLQVIFDLKIDGIFGKNTANAVGAKSADGNFTYDRYLYTIQEFLYS